MSIIVHVNGDNLIVAEPQRFSSGSLGYFGQARIYVDGCLYMAQVQLVAISTQPSETLMAVEAAIGATADALAAARAAKKAARAAKAAAATTTPAQRAALDNARARKK